MSRKPSTDTSRDMVSGEVFREEIGCHSSVHFVVLCTTLPQQLLNPELGTVQVSFFLHFLEKRKATETCRCVRSHLQCVLLFSLVHDVSGIQDFHQNFEHTASLDDQLIYRCLPTTPVFQLDTVQALHYA